MKTSHYWSDFVEQQTWKFLWSDSQAPSAPHWFPLSLLNRPELVSFMCCSTERCIFASLWRKHTRTRVWNPPQPLSNHRSQIVDRIKIWGFSFSWIQNVNWMISDWIAGRSLTFLFWPTFKKQKCTDCAEPDKAGLAVHQPFLKSCFTTVLCCVTSQQFVNVILIQWNK